MFEWFWRWWGRLWSKEVIPIEEMPAPKVGDKFPVKNEDEARAVILNLCFQHEGMIMAEAEWNEDGTGFVVVTSVSK